MNDKKTQNGKNAGRIIRCRILFPQGSGRRDSLPIAGKAGKTDVQNDEQTSVFGTFGTGTGVKNDETSRASGNIRVGIRAENGERSSMTGTFDAGTGEQNAGEQSGPGNFRAGISVLNNEQPLVSGTNRAGTCEPAGTGEPS